LVGCPGRVELDPSIEGSVAPTHPAATGDRSACYGLYLASGSRFSVDVGARHEKLITAAKELAAGMKKKQADADS